MNEIWDVYDINKRKTGKKAEKNVYKFQDGEYHIISTGVIMNSKNNILVSKRAPTKKYGGLWECNGGSIRAGETSLQGVLRELHEELGINLSGEEATLLKETRKDKGNAVFNDIWLFQKDINKEEIKFSDGESTECKWITIEQFEEMTNNNEFAPTFDFNKNDYEKIINENMDNQR